MSNPYIWYVAFGPDKLIKSDDRTAGPARTTKARSTKTFTSEEDAKKFALEVISKGWTASAGTLNPYQPKQTIASSKIEHWADPQAF